MSFAVGQSDLPYARADEELVPFRSEPSWPSPLTTYFARCTCNSCLAPRRTRDQGLHPGPQDHRRGAAGRAFGWRLHRQDIRPARRDAADDPGDAQARGSWGQVRNGMPDRGWVRAGAEEIIPALSPDRHEVYQTASDWLPWLSKLPNVVLQDCDGHTLSRTPDGSVDLVHAHKLFVYCEFFTTVGYLEEMARVVRPGGAVAFDIVTEECLDDETVPNGSGYPRSTVQSPGVGRRVHGAARSHAALFALLAAAAWKDGTPGLRSRLRLVLLEARSRARCSTFGEFTGPMTSSLSGPEVYRDHPVRPVARQDPLHRPKGVNRAPGPKNGMSTDWARPRIGFACKWEQIPKQSVSPWNLREALRSVTDTIDIGVQVPRLSQTVLKAVHTRYHGRLTRACPVDHETGWRSQIRIEATSMVPRQTKSRLSYLVATARCWRSWQKARSTMLRCL